MKIALGFVFLVGLSVNSAAQDSGSTRLLTPGISLAISAAEDPIPIGSPVKLKLSLKNNSSQNYVVFTDVPQECSYTTEVRDENGKIPPETKLGTMLNGHVAVKEWESLGLTAEEIVSRCGNEQSFNFKAGDSVVQSLAVTHLYKFSTAGKYSIQVVLDQTLIPNGVFAKSNTIAVTITP